LNLITQFLLGIALSLLIASIAYYRKSLSKSGFFGALIIGTAIFGFGGWVWGSILFTFFFLSTLLSFYKKAAKRVISEKFEKGSQRDIGQTMANGGAGAILAIIYILNPDPIIFIGFIGVMATVNADTWATELGVLAKHPPKLITTWKTVEPGTSGGISIPGTLASLAGSLAIGLTAALFLTIEGINSGWQYLIPAVFGGFAGCMFDSLLGATAQAIYYSPTRQKETEKKIEPDGSMNIHKKGLLWLNNDLVNFISSLVGMLVAAFIWWI